MNWTIWGSIPDWTKRYFSSPQRSDYLLGPSSLLFNEYGCSFLAVKRSGREFDPSCPSIAEVKNDWSCSCVLPLCIRSVDRVSCTFHCYRCLQLTSWLHILQRVPGISVWWKDCSFYSCFIFNRLKRRKKLLVYSAILRRFNDTWRAVGCYLIGWVR